MELWKKGALATAVATLIGIGVYATQVQAQLPSEGVTGIQRVVASSEESTVKNKAVTASCPSGKVATGGGYAVTGANPGSVAVYVNAPTSDVSWQAKAKRTVNLSRDWTLSAIVVCATGTPSSTPSPSPSTSPSASPSSSPGLQ
jgi:hypothetical protein